jgi:hypothetical protein
MILIPHRQPDDLDSDMAYGSPGYRTETARAVVGQKEARRKRQGETSMGRRW